MYSYFQNMHVWNKFKFSNTTTNTGTITGFDGRNLSYVNASITNLSGTTVSYTTCKGTNLSILF